MIEVTPGRLQFPITMSWDSHYHVRNGIRVPEIENAHDGIKYLNDTIPRHQCTTRLANTEAELW